MNTLCVSNEILAEYEEILQRLAGKDTADYVLDALVKSKYVELVSPYYRFNLIQTDPDDNKFVDCAIQANARYIVTNDRHYDVLQYIVFPKVDVVKLADFLMMIKKFTKPPKIAGNITGVRFPMPTGSSVLCENNGFISSKHFFQHRLFQRITLH